MHNIADSKDGCPPFVLFHGTDAEFERFRIPDGCESGPPDIGLGAFFTEEPDIASLGVNRAKSTRRQPWLYAVHLSPNLTFKHYDEMFFISRQAGPQQTFCEADIRLAGDPAKLRRKLQAEGYDGVVIRNFPRMYVIFDPDHIHIGRREALPMPPPWEDLWEAAPGDHQNGPVVEARMGWFERVRRLMGL